MLRNNLVFMDGTLSRRDIKGPDMFRRSTVSLYISLNETNPGNMHFRAFGSTDHDWMSFTNDCAMNFLFHIRGAFKF